MDGSIGQQGQGRDREALIHCDGTKDDITACVCLSPNQEDVWLPLGYERLFIIFRAIKQSRTLLQLE
jgi:hypothetical protein